MVHLRQGRLINNGTPGVRGHLSNILSHNSTKVSNERESLSL
jgi:hypothetical protein